MNNKNCFHNKKEIIIACMLCHSLLAESQTCLPDGITFTTQAQIDAFTTNYPGCTEIEGYVEIFDAVSDIVNLNGLSTLTSIRESLTISFTTLTNFTGLEGLSHIGRDLSINNAGMLTSLTGFEGLTSVEGSIDIRQNPSLESLKGLDSLKKVGLAIRIGFNDALQNLNGLSSLSSVGDEVTVFNNATLLSLIGLENLDTIYGDLAILSNPSLLEIQSLSDLKSFEDLRVSFNTQLLNISGFDSMCVLNGIYIEDNNSLISLTLPTKISSINNDVIFGFNESLPDLKGLLSVTTILGNLVIWGNSSLTSLDGLNSITWVGGHLSIASNQALTSLSGLDSLGHIGFDLLIQENSELENLNTLKSVTFVGSSILVTANNSLTSLSGLDNIDHETLSVLAIENSPMLSMCDVPSVCNYLAISENLALISGNAAGCASREEIEALCIVSTDDYRHVRFLEFYPNPTSRYLNVVDEEMNGIGYNLSDWLGRHIKEGIVSGGRIDISGVPPGMYVVSIQSTTRANAIVLIN